MPGKRLEKTDLRIGFIPLTDCAPLVVAREKGFFQRHGLKVALSRESSWANIRDKVSVGMLDGAQMLAGMPLASACRTDVSAPMITALSLDLNGNAITVSNALYARMRQTGEPDLDSPMGSARALKQVIDVTREEGGAPLVFAVVFPFSSHNYLLRYWMAAAGIDPDQDLRLTVVPPPQMVNYLRAGVISGFCVGEPWNAQAVAAGLGSTLVASYDIWNNHPEKVLGVTWSWAAENPNTHQALLAALLEAAVWLDEPANRQELCELLSLGRYVNAPADVLERSLNGSFLTAADGAWRQGTDFLVFNRYAANMPWRSHALWFMTQMVRWGQLGAPINLRTIAEQVYRPDIYRKAAARLSLPVSQFDYKDEGHHAQTWASEETGCNLELGADLFFDDRAFSPADAIEYLQGFQVHRLAMPLGELARVNPPWTAEQRHSRLAAGDAGDHLLGEAG